jgi:hypothetical protein
VPDITSPDVSGTPDRPANRAGWYNADVIITWTSVDPHTSSGTPTQPPHTVASLEGTHEYVSAPSCDPAGNCATGKLTLNIDKTKPSVTGVNAGGLFKTVNQPVTITASATDNLALAGGEFFINADPGVGKAPRMHLSGNTLTGMFTPTQSGFYLVGVRVRDAADNWSTLSGQSFSFIWVL